jgi:outer membrane murein-binding lipoprotein Lpp
MTALTLYEIAQEYRADLEKLAELELDDETLTDTLDGMGGELQVKAQSVACFIRNLEATVEQIKQAEAAMSARRKALENRAARVKDYLLASMMVAGVQKVECPLFRMTVRDNPAAVEVYQPELIPAQFMRQPEPPPPAVDKAAIKEAMKAGQEVPGCRLTVGKRLEIK